MTFCRIFDNIRPIWNIFSVVDGHKNLLHKWEFLETRSSESHTLFRTANALLTVFDTLIF